MNRSIILLAMDGMLVRTQIASSPPFLSSSPICVTMKRSNSFMKFGPTDRSISSRARALRRARPASCCAGSTRVTTTVSD